jgi:hypothetical protein
MDVVQVLEPAHEVHGACNESIGGDESMVRVERLDFEEDFAAACVDSEVAWVSISLAWLQNDMLPGDECLGRESGLQQAMLKADLVKIRPQSLAQLAEARYAPVDERLKARPQSDRVGEGSRQAQ